MNRFATLAAALTLVAACDYHDTKDQPAAAPSPNGSGLTGTTSFAALQQDLLTPYCVSCHNATNAKDGVALDSFAGAALAKNGEGVALVVPGKAEGSLLYTIIASGSMPKGPGVKPTAQQLADLKAWIDAGADQTAQVPTKPVSAGPQPQAEQPVPSLVDETPAEPTWTSVSAKFLAAKCAGCHSPRPGNRPPAGNIPLNAYDALIAANAGGTLLNLADPDHSQLIDSVVAGRMPKRAAPLSAQEIDVLKAWIKAGAPRD